MLSELQKVLYERVDIYDDESRRMLLAMNEEEQMSGVQNLCGRLYQKLIDEKFSQIDLGGIGKSKGDIEQYEGYQSTLDSLEIITGLMKEFKSDTTEVDKIYTTIDNIKKNKQIFMDGYAFNVELIMVMYSTMVMAVVSSTSMLIGACVDYIKSPDGTFKMKFDNIQYKKYTKECLLFDNMSAFNKSCTKQDFQKAMNYVLSQYKTTHNLLGGVAVGSAIAATAVVTLTVVIIPILREIIYYFFYYRVKISDYLETQAQLLEMNAYQVEANNVGGTKESSKRIATQQKAIADIFKKTSSKLSVRMKQANNKAKADAKKDASMKVKTSDIIDQLPEKMSAEKEPSSSSQALF